MQPEQVTGAPQGAKVVLLAFGDMYLELMQKDGDTIQVLGPHGGQSVGSITKLQAAGFVARQAYKLVKTDGSWLYMAHGPHGVDLYQAGRFCPAKPLGAVHVRTL